MVLRNQWTLYGAIFTGGFSLEFEDIVPIRETEYPLLNPCNRLYNKSLARHNTKISGREEAHSACQRDGINTRQIVSGVSPSNVPLSAAENTKTIKLHQGLLKEYVEECAEESMNLDVSSYSGGYFTGTT